MKIKVLIIVILTIFLIVFVLQNTENVIVKLWFWELSIPRALLLFVCFAIGLVIGLIIPASRKSGAEQTRMKTGQQE